MGNTNKRKVSRLPAIGTHWYEGCVGKYVILSLTHSTKDAAVWYMPGDSGYTTSMVNAGKYPMDAVVSRIDYYNNGVSTMAVPLTHEAFDLLDIEYTSFDMSNLDKFLTIVTSATD